MGPYVTTVSRSTDSRCRRETCSSSSSNGVNKWRPVVRWIRHRSQGRPTDGRTASSNDEVIGTGHHTPSFGMRFRRRLLPYTAISKRRDPHSDHSTTTRQRLGCQRRAVPSLLSVSISNFRLLQSSSDNSSDKMAVFNIHSSSCLWDSYFSTLCSKKHVTTFLMISWSRTFTKIIGKLITKI